MKRSFMVLVLALLAGVAHAETVYITDQLYVSLRPAQNNDGPSIKTERTGTALQVLGRDNGFVQVKDPSGDQGWIADRYLTSEPPARLKLDGLALKLDEMQAQLDKARADLVAARYELKVQRASARLAVGRLQPRGPLRHHSFQFYIGLALHFLQLLALGNVTAYRQ